MTQPSPSDLPLVIVIDDQFGRCQLGDAFKRSVGDEIFSLYEADRDNLCHNFGLVPRGRKVAVDDPVAEAVFCPAQRWNDRTKEIENVPEQCVGVIRQHWPAADGSRLALILLDLRFTYGPVSEFGDPARGSLFGADVILPLLEREFGPELPVVVLSSTERAEMNPKIRQGGALDFIQRVPGAGAPRGESRRILRDALATHGLLRDPEELVAGQSLAVLNMLRLARRAAKSARTVLLEGETGTGKGLLARFIHRQSARRLGPFETFNAAQRNAELQADELFGHWRGAFTDAAADSPGVWERADGGVLFIDEVADLDESVQLRLMQPIEERTVRRLGHPPRGAAAEIPVDVLVVLATNRSLQNRDQVKADFLNRINALVIPIPPLRERREDIPLLARRLTRQLFPAWEGELVGDAMSALMAYDWRGGNIRELRNTLERALTNNPAQDITPRDLQLKGSAAPVVQARAGIVAAAPRPPFAELFDADLDAMTSADIRKVSEELRGALPLVMARILDLALRLTASDGAPNHTAAVRLILGRNEITTLEAKQFLRKCLSLDTRGGQVWKHFEDISERTTSGLLDNILARLRRRDHARTKRQEHAAVKDC